MTDLTAKLITGIKQGTDQIRIYETRIADMNDAQCRLALMWVLSNMDLAKPATDETNARSAPPKNADQFKGD